MAAGLESLVCGLRDQGGWDMPADLGFYTLQPRVLCNLQTFLSLSCLNCKLAILSSNLETSGRCSHTPVKSTVSDYPQPSVGPRATLTAVLAVVKFSVLVTVLLPRRGTMTKAT